jgi:tetratricopeptide (TPR) repeat protein
MIAFGFVFVMLWLAATPVLAQSFPLLVLQANEAARQGNTAEAERLFQAALSSAPANLQARNQALMPLMDIYLRARELHKVEYLLTGFLERLKRARPEDPVMIGTVESDLAIFYELRTPGKEAEGHKLAKEAIERFRGCLTTRPECLPRLADVLAIEAGVLLRKGRIEDAQPLFEEVANIPESYVKPEAMLASLQALAGIYQRMGKPETAAVWAQRAADFEKKNPEAGRRLRGIV